VCLNKCFVYFVGLLISVFVCRYNFIHYISIVVHTEEDRMSPQAIHIGVPDENCRLEGEEIDQFVTGNIVEYCAKSCI